MKYFTKLVLITLLGVALLALLAFAVYWLRDVLAASGRPVSDRIFLIVLIAVLCGAFGLLSKVVLRLTASDGKAKGERNE